MGKLYLLLLKGGKGRGGKEGREFDLCPRKKKKKSAHLLAREK